MKYYIQSNYLIHHGIKGQKWGVRRYQNPDGSLTAAGKKRYFNDDGTLTKKGEKASKKFRNIRKREYQRELNRKVYEQYDKDVKAADEYADKHGLASREEIRLTDENRSGFRERALMYGFTDDYVNKVLKYNDMLDTASIKLQKGYDDAQKKVKSWLEQYGDTLGWDIPKR